MGLPGSRRPHAAPRRPCRPPPGERRDESPASRRFSSRVSRRAIPRSSRGWEGRGPLLGSDFRAATSYGAEEACLLLHLCSRSPTSTRSGGPSNIRRQLPWRSAWSLWPSRLGILSGHGGRACRETAAGLSLGKWRLPIPARRSASADTDRRSTRTVRAPQRVVAASSLGRSGIRKDRRSHKHLGNRWAPCPECAAS
jgi:hypothetical protein